MTTHAIVCPAHVARASVRGDERFCPVGDHRLTRWWIVDERREVVLYTVSAEAGVEREINTALARCPRLAVEDVSMTEKERSMPRGVPGSGPFGDPSKAPATKVRAKSCLASAKFAVGGRTLWLRLFEAKVKDDATRFRVRWELLDGKESESGVAFASPTAPDARAAYDKACRQAETDGWVPSRGGALKLRPVPAPPAEAAAKRKRVA